MLLIIAHHFACHAIYPTEISIFNGVILSAFFIGGKLGVNLFVLISGYFLSKSNIKLKKIIKLILQVDFYSILLYLIFAGIENNITVGGFFENLFAIFFEKYWFMTAYVVLYLLSPIINILISKLKQNMHFVLMFISIGLFFGLSYVPYINFLVNIGWFFTLYLIGSFMRKYGENYLKKVRWYYSLIAFFVLYVLIIFIQYKFGINFAELTNPIGLVMAICLFLTFKQSKIKNIKFLNLVASFTLGIYLIHDNNFVRGYIWNNLFNCGYHSQYNYFVVFAIVAVIVVFVACSIIEYLRQKLFAYIEKFINFLIIKIKEHKKIKN